MGSVPNPEAHFTLWPKVERSLVVSTNQIARNPEFGLSILHTRDQISKAVVFQIAHMAVFI
jgi:hypothetical protein